jgi:hypothetical protein
VAVTLGGRPFTLKLGLGAMTALQEQIRREIDQVLPPDLILQEATRGRLLYMRAFIWAALQRYHPECTLREVEDLLDLASVEEIQALFASLGLLALPDPADVQALGVAATGRPPKGRRRGTGGGSTSTPGASA